MWTCMWICQILTFLTQFVGLKILCEFQCKCLDFQCKTFGKLDLVRLLHEHAHTMHMLYYVLFDGKRISMVHVLCFLYIWELCFFLLMLLINFNGVSYHLGMKYKQCVSQYWIHTLWPRSNILPFVVDVNFSCHPSHYWESSYW